MQTKEDLLAPFKEWVKEEEDGPPLSDDLATIVDKLITGQEDKDKRWKLEQRSTESPKTPPT